MQLQTQSSMTAPFPSVCSLAKGWAWGADVCSCALAHFCVSAYVWPAILPPFSIALPYSTSNPQSYTSHCGFLRCRCMLSFAQQIRYRSRTSTSWVSDAECTARQTYETHAGFKSLPMPADHHRLSHQGVLQAGNRIVRNCRLGDIPTDSAACLSTW